MSGQARRGIGICFWLPLPNGADIVIVAALSLKLLLGTTDELSGPAQGQVGIGVGHESRPVVGRVLVQAGGCFDRSST
jgi:hypothetical protein